MKTLFTVASITSFVLLASLMICGLWIRFSGNPVDDSSIRFHMVLGIVTSLVVVTSLVAGMVAVRSA